MKTPALVMFALSVIVSASFCGCYQDPVRAKLAGTWKIEHGDKLSRRVNQDDDAGSRVDDPSERMVLSFFASGSLQTKTRMGDVIREKNGSWNVVDFDEEESRMKIRCELMGQQTDHDIRFLEPDLIRLIPPNMAGTSSKLTFRRH